MADLESYSNAMVYGKLADGTKSNHPLKNGRMPFALDLPEGEHVLAFEIKTMLAHPWKRLVEEIGAQIKKGNLPELNMQNAEMAHSVKSDKFPTFSAMRFEFSVAVENGKIKSYKPTTRILKDIRFERKVPSIKLVIPFVDSDLLEVIKGSRTHQHVDYEFENGGDEIGVHVTGLVNELPVMNSRFILLLKVAKKQEKKEAPTPKLKAKIDTLVYGPFSTGSSKFDDIDRKASVRGALNYSKLRSYYNSLSDATKLAYEGAKELPDGKTVIVTGHADNRGTEAKNHTLSGDRAKAVAQMLSEMFGCDKTVFSIKAGGERVRNKDGAKGSDEPENRVAVIQLYTFS